MEKGLKLVPTQKKEDFCDHKGSCFYDIGYGFYRNFLIGCAIRLALRVLSERNIPKIL
jgi:hypothetical protein